MKYRLLLFFLFFNLLSFVFSLKEYLCTTVKNCTYENICSWTHNVFRTGLGNVLPNRRCQITQHVLDAWRKAANLRERVSFGRMGNSNPDQCFRREKRCSQIRNYSGNTAILSGEFHRWMKNKRSKKRFQFSEKTIVSQYCSAGCREKRPGHR